MGGSREDVVIGGQPFPLLRSLKSVGDRSNPLKVVPFLSERVIDLVHVFDHRSDLLRPGTPRRFGSTAQHGIPKPSPRISFNLAARRRGDVPALPSPRPNPLPAALAGWSGLRYERRPRTDWPVRRNEQPGQ